MHKPKNMDSFAAMEKASEKGEITSATDLSISFLTVESRVDDKLGLIDRQGGKMEGILNRNIIDSIDGDMQPLNAQIVRAGHPLKEVYGRYQPPDQEHPLGYIEINRIYFPKQ